MSGLQQAGQTQSIVQEARLRLHQSDFRLVMGIGQEGKGGGYQISVGGGKEISDLSGQTASNGIVCHGISPLLLSVSSKHTQPEYSHSFRVVAAQYLTPYIAL